MKTSVGLLAAITMIGCATVSADESTQKASKSEQDTFRLSRPQPQAPRLSLEFEKTDVRSVLNAIADAGGVAVIIASNVPKTPISYLRFNDVAPEKAIQRVCESVGLAVSVQENSIASRLSGTARVFIVAPRQAESTPASQTLAEKPPHSSWQRFEFNGVPYYLIPLE